MSGYLAGRVILISIGSVTLVGNVDIEVAEEFGGLEVCGTMGAAEPLETRLSVAGDGGWKEYLCDRGVRVIRCNQLMIDGEDGNIGMIKGMCGRQVRVYLFQRGSEDGECWNGVRIKAVCTESVVGGAVKGKVSGRFTFVAMGRYSRRVLRGAEGKVFLEAEGCGILC